MKPTSVTQIGQGVEPPCESPGKTPAGKKSSVSRVRGAQDRNRGIEDRVEK